MLTSLFFAWTLLVQVQLQLCQDGVCTPHPQLQDKTQILRTLEHESDCLVLQMDMQREYHKVQPSAPPVSRRRVEAKTTFVCQPSH